MDDFGRWVLITLIPTVFAAVAWTANQALHYFDNERKRADMERERTVEVQDAASARAEKAHEGLVATLNNVIATCRDERADALRVSREERESFVTLLDGAFREHNETSRQIAQAVAEMRVEFMRAKMEGRFE